MGKDPKNKINILIIMKLYSIQDIAFAMNLYKKKFKKSGIFSILYAFEANQMWKKDVAK